MTSGVPSAEGSQSQEVITPEMWSTYQWARNEWCYGPDRTGVDREAFAIAAMLNTSDLPRLRAENERLKGHLSWALERIIMPGCRCKTGNDGLCTCDYDSWPEYRARAEARAALGGSQAKGSE